MFAKQGWFKRRKYTGWGLTPASWQGWLYILVIIAPLIAVQEIDSIPGSVRLWFMLGWAAVIAVDLIDTMRKLPTDEREKIHEALAERNALWTILIVLTVGVAYQAAQTAIRGQVLIDPFIIAALLLATATKAISNYYLDHKD